MWQSIIVLEDFYDDAMAIRKMALSLEYPDPGTAAAYSGRNSNKALLNQGGPGSGPMVYDQLRRAMECYEKAEPLRPSGNDAAILRWNTCARVIMAHDHVRPGVEEPAQTMLE